MSTGSHEIEIKLAVADARAARGLLRRAGFRVWRKRVFEANTVYDTADAAMRQTNRLLRIREAGGKSTITYKGVPLPGPHKSREEIETEVSAPGQMATIFSRLGFQPAFRYEKYRTEFREAGGVGVATVDETPIGVFLELEGPPRWIDRTALRLGFTQADYITASYGRLYYEWRQTHGESPANMVFRGG